MWHSVPTLSSSKSSRSWAWPADVQFICLFRSSFEVGYPHRWNGSQTDPTVRGFSIAGAGPYSLSDWISVTSTPKGTSTNTKSPSNRRSSAGKSCRTSPLCNANNNVLCWLCIDTAASLNLIPTKSFEIRILREFCDVP